MEGRYLVFVGVFVFLVLVVSGVGSGGAEKLKDNSVANVLEKEIISHRCLSKEKLGDSVEKGADMIEFDVRMTGDGVLVAIHDEKFEGKRLSELDYDDLEGVERVEDMLKIFKGENSIGLNSKKVVLELKEKGYEREIMDLVLKHVDGSILIVTSGSVESLRIIKEEYGVKTGLILYRKDWLRTFGITALGFFPGALYSRSGADYLFVPYDYLSSRFLNEADKRGVGVYVWTLSGEADLKKYLGDKRIRGVVTSDVGVAVSLSERLSGE